MAKFVQLKDTQTGEAIYPITALPNVGEVAYEDVVPIEMGGTSKTTREESRQHFNFMGSNIITSDVDDTVDFWTAQGTGVARFSNYYLIDQPAKYVMLINMTNGSDVKQMLFILPTGRVYHRGGNASGWDGTWRRFLEETNGLSMELLWQNASPTSAFAAQTISLDLSGDSKIIIEFNSDSSSGVKDIQTIINPVVVGKGGVAIRFGGVQDNYLGNIHFRYYQVTNNSITFNNSYYQAWTGTTATLNNNFVIPYRVYVIKGVQ